MSVICPQLYVFSYIHVCVCILLKPQYSFPSSTAKLFPSAFYTCSVAMQWRIQMGIQGCTGTPLWAAPSTKKYTDVRLNWTPLSGYRTRKLLLWLTLECFRRNSFENRSIGLVGLVVCLKNERKWAWLLNIRAQQYIRTPLLEILDPPLRSASHRLLENASQWP